jgi:hypothetical protein
MLKLKQIFNSKLFLMSYPSLTINSQIIESLKINGTINSHFRRAQQISIKATSLV